MPRIKRIIVPGSPHHVTQRGSRRQQVFFHASDRALYLSLLHSSAKKFKVDIIAYCLMSNHVHLLLAPEDREGLRWTLQLTHKRYADAINKRMQWKGHLWQERFYSCAVDETHFWVALRYIERNPVEAALVKHASEYPWSSAAAHCGLRSDPVLTISPRWKSQLVQRANWHAWLNESDTKANVDKLRSSTARDLPCGSDLYLNELERELQQPVRASKRGRPRKV